MTSCPLPFFREDKYMSDYFFAGIPESEFVRKACTVEHNWYLKGEFLKELTERALEKNAKKKLFFFEFYRLLLKKRKKRS